MPFIVAFMSSGIIYGSIHLLGWNAPFITSAQMIIWKMSALILVGSSLAFILLRLSAWFVEALNRYRHHFISHGLFSIILKYTYRLYAVINGGLVYIWMLSYLITRVYLIVEPLLSLPYLPKQVFEQPN